MRRHYWEYFGPLMFQQASRHLGVTNSKTCVYLHFAACYHYVQLLHCAKLVVIVVVDHLHGLALAFVFCLLSPLTLSSSPPPPPGSEASLGNSLNTSEEELHTAGITMAPKGTRDSHQPISIQIALVHTVIAITFALITIAATQNPSTLGWELFCFYTTKPLPLWRLSPPLSKSPAGVSCAVMETLAQVCLNDTDHRYISMDENKKGTRRCHSLRLCLHRIPPHIYNRDPRWSRQAVEGLQHLRSASSQLVEKKLKLGFFCSSRSTLVHMYSNSGT